MVKTDRQRGIWSERGEEDRGIEREDEREREREREKE